MADQFVVYVNGTQSSKAPAGLPARDGGDRTVAGEADEISRSAPDNNSYRASIHPGQTRPAPLAIPRNRLS